MEKEHRLTENGQTLIEILIAIAVVVMVLVAVVSRVVDAVGNANFARNQLLSTRFAQEGIEWTRSQRDRLGWDEFVLALDSDPVTYCVLDLSTNPNLEDLISGSCTAMIPGTLFDREIDIDYTDVGDPAIGDYVDVTVTVSWQDRISEHSTVLSTRLSNWTK